MISFLNLGASHIVSIFFFEAVPSVVRDEYDLSLHKLVFWVHC